MHSVREFLCCMKLDHKVKVMANQEVPNFDQHIHGIGADGPRLVPDQTKMGDTEAADGDGVELERAEWDKSNDGDRWE